MTNYLSSNLVLLPQECGGDYKFSSQPYMTRGFLNAFQSDAATITAHSLELIYSRHVRGSEGADYLQVFECGDIHFWCIDDVSLVTFLLPEEY